MKRQKKMIKNEKEVEEEMKVCPEVLKIGRQVYVFVTSPLQPG